jgi:hypothetical protein
MESTGTTYKTVNCTINQKLVDEINGKEGINYSLRDFEAATDKCLANEWLERKYMGCSMYSNLAITQKGLGVVRSKRRQEELKKSRSWLKKISDFIEDHKGLFIVLGFLLAIATFILKILGDI